MKTILAVAVGKSTNKEFATPNPDFSTVRPYVKGLEAWLKKPAAPPAPDGSPPAYKIGKDYKIEYRERPHDNLRDAFRRDAFLAELIFCMSSSVAKVADAFAKEHALSTPIVAIVSDPYGEDFGSNVCGVSASRDRLAIKCLDAFRSADKSLGSIYALHRTGYGPSNKAKGWLGGRVIPWPVADGQDIKARIDRIPPGKNQGLLILPADRFFGDADEIVRAAAARSMKTFWSTPDFPPNAFGGYGYKQELCGRFLAERVASIWNNVDLGVSDPMPDPKWVAIGSEHVSVGPKAPTRKKPAKRRKRAKKST